MELYKFSLICTRDLVFFLLCDSSEKISLFTIVTFYCGTMVEVLMLSLLEPWQILSCPSRKVVIIWSLMLDGSIITNPCRVGFSGFVSFILHFHGSVRWSNILYIEIFHHSCNELEVLLHQLHEYFYHK